MISRQWAVSSGDSWRESRKDPESSEVQNEVYE
jgi:hypothetical protein